MDQASQGLSTSAGSLDTRGSLATSRPIGLPTLPATYRHPGRLLAIMTHWPTLRKDTIELFRTTGPTERLPGTRTLELRHKEGSQRSSASNEPSWAAYWLPALAMGTSTSITNASITRTPSYTAPAVPTRRQTTS